MALWESSDFAGKTIEDWNEGVVISPDICYRISISYEEGEEGQVWTDKFAAFLDDPDSAKITGFVVGMWQDAYENNSSPIVEALVAARNRLPNLKALFIGDIEPDECEISWIIQSDLTPLFEAFPKLEYFGSRGGEGLRVGPINHQNLKWLALEAGGLPVEVVREVQASDLPNLEHLELWLGTPSYGGNTSVEDLEPLLSGRIFPNLKYLGLRDSEIADDIAEALATSSVVEHIEVLDLSLGTLTDKGVKTLLTNPAILQLQKLDLHHHFCSDELIEQLKALPITVDVSDTQEPEVYNGEEYRYASVRE